MICNKNDENSLKNFDIKEKMEKGEAFNQALRDFSQRVRKSIRNPLYWRSFSGALGG